MYFFVSEINRCQADATDNKTNKKVPIAVGAALAALVVMVIVAYFIGRRRRRRRRNGFEFV